MQKGGNMKEVFHRFCTGLTKVCGVRLKDFKGTQLYNIVRHLTFKEMCIAHHRFGVHSI